MNITLDSVARSYLVNNGKNTLHGYVRVLKHLVDFMKKFSLNHSFMDKTIILKLDEKKAIQMPDDFVTWNKIGWKSGDRIVAFQRDKSIALQQSYCEDVGSATLNSAYNINYDWPYSDPIQLNNYYWGSNCGSLQAYGVGYNGVGYFRVNWERREIQFSTDTPVDYEIYIEYKTNGFSAKTKSVIPETVAKLAEDYAHWQLGVYKLGAASSEAQARKKNYSDEYDESMAQNDKFSLEDLVGARARSFDVNKIVR